MGNTDILVPTVGEFLFTLASQHYEGYDLTGEVPEDVLKAVLKRSRFKAPPEGHKWVHQSSIDMAHSFGLERLLEEVTAVEEKRSALSAKQRATVVERYTIFATNLGTFLENIKSFQGAADLEAESYVEPCCPQGCEKGQPTADCVGYSKEQEAEEEREKEAEEGNFYVDTECYVTAADLKEKEEVDIEPEGDDEGLPF